MPVAFSSNRLVQAGRYPYEVGPAQGAHFFLGGGGIMGVEGNGPSGRREQQSTIV